ncbi:MAG TPA: S8 family serine peptidase [Candidatus Diapherotrites archaeon]|uniref:S8 family serine peptidase n=1 Tax=Candidatus Iainarchaeum sp. TaxID=3101447 RepID=A0A7J4J1S1_9ARCH|nr:S8 family serine peptidase [Candidatus Diapherotrites archaeon]
MELKNSIARLNSIAKILAALLLIALIVPFTYAAQDSSVAPAGALAPYAFAKGSGAAAYISKIHPELLQFSKTKSLAAGLAKKVEALVSVQDDDEIARVEGVITRNGGTVEKSFSTGNVIVANVPQSGLLGIAADDSVVSLWPDTIVRATLDESVPQIGAIEAWASGHDGSGISVAVLDTGIDSTHPMLKGKVVKEKNLTPSLTSSDVYGHGTHVAGIIAGNTAEGGAYNGVAPQASLYNVKVLGDDGEGEFSKIIEGIDWVVGGLEWAAGEDGRPYATEGARIINMSLGAPENYDPNGSNQNPLLRAIREATENGIVVVVSAGNCGDAEPSEVCKEFRGVTTPGSSPDALTVGAVNDENNWAGFSSGGSIEGVGIKPDIAAPGVGINSSIPRSRYQAMDGTSMAAPHVAGAAALLLDSNPALTSAQIKGLLEMNAIDLGGPGKDTKFGYGLLNLRGISGLKPAISEETVSGTIEESQIFTKSITLANRGAQILMITGVSGPNGVELALGKNELSPMEETYLNVIVNGYTTGIGQISGDVVVSTNAGELKIAVEISVVQSAKPVIKEHNIPPTVFRGEKSDIVVLATDDSTVNSVSFRLTGPNGIITDNQLVLSGDGKWRLKDFEYPAGIGDKGEYTAGITALDDSGNPTTLDVHFELVNAVFSFPKEFTQGTESETLVSYKNTGNLSAEAKANLEIFASDGAKIDEITQSALLASGEEKAFSLKWTPQEAGNYLLRAGLGENGNAIEAMDLNARALVPDVLNINGFSMDGNSVEKGTSAKFTILAENTSSASVDTIIEVNILKNNITLDTISMEGAGLPANSTQQPFTLQKAFVLPAGEYGAVARLHNRNRAKDSNTVAFTIYAPAMGSITSIETPQTISTDHNSVVRAVFSNSSAVPLNVMMNAKVMDGNNIVDSFDLNAMQVLAGQDAIFEAEHGFRGLVGQYTLVVFADYEGNSAQAGKGINISDNDSPKVVARSYGHEITEGEIFEMLLVTQDASPVSSATLTVDGTETEMLKTGSFDRNTTFTGTYYKGLGAGTHTFSVKICDKFGNCTSMPQLRFNVTECTGNKVLVVSEEDYFKNELGTGYCVANWKKSISGTPDSQYMSGFSAVIWGEGNSRKNIDANDAMALKEYVNNGGRLLLEGSEIAFAHRDDNFMQSVAHAQLARDIVFIALGAEGTEGTTESSEITVKTIHPITMQESTFSLDGSIVPSPDAIKPANGGVSLADWNSGDSAMVAFEEPRQGGARVLFVPFNFNAIETGPREKIFSGAMKWLLEMPGNDIAITGLEATPLPKASEPVQVTIELSNGAAAEVALYDNNEKIGATTASNGTAKMQVSLSEGKHTIVAIANPDFGEAETTYFNNSAEKELMVAGPMPDAALSALKITPQNPRQGESVKIEAIASNLGAATANAEIRFIVNGAQIGVAPVEIAFGEEKTASANWVAEEGIHYIEAVAAVSGEDSNALNNASNAEIYACNGPWVLIVSDDDTASGHSTENPDSLTTFEEALQGERYCFESWKESEKGVPSKDYLQAFDTVIWSAGDRWNTVVDSNDMSLLRDFNGSIFFEGSDIGFDNNDPEFMEMEMHSSFDRDIVLGTENSILLLNDSNIFEGIGSLDLNAELSPFPDSIIPLDGESIADWNSGGSAIIVSGSGKNKQVYAAFSVDAIADGNSRNTFITNAVKWLLETNSAPEILSITANSPVNEGETLIIDVNAVDADNDPLSYAIHPDLFDSNGSTFSWITDYNSAGDYNFTITVSDGDMNASKDISITVLNTNRPPVINGITDNAPIQEGEALTIDVNAADPDGDALDYAINSDAFGADGNQLTWATDYNSAGDYAFTITVSDGDMNASADLNITILNANRPPEILSVTTNSPVNEPGELIIDANATDPDGDAITYAIDSDKFGKNGNRFMWQTDYESAGDYNFTLSVSDGDMDTTADINIAILNTNRAPEILSVETNSPIQEGETLTIDVNALDLDNGPVLLSIANTGDGGPGNHARWWNTGYAKRMPVNIQTNSSPIDYNHTLAGRINTAETGCLDLSSFALVWQNGESQTDIDMAIEGTCGEYIEVTWRSQFAIEPNTDFTTVDTNGYYLYIANNAIQNPKRDPTKVWLGFESFEDNEYTANPVWEIRAGSPVVVEEKSPDKNHYLDLQVGASTNMRTDFSSDLNANWFEIWVRPSDVSTAVPNNPATVILANSADELILHLIIGANQFYRYEGGWRQIGSAVPENNQWYRYLIYYDGHSKTFGLTIYSQSGTILEQGDFSTYTPVGGGPYSGEIAKIYVGSEVTNAGFDAIKYWRQPEDRPAITTGAIGTPGKPTQINYDKNRFTWQTDYNSAGDYAFTITATDGNLSTNADLNVSIINSNRAPIITAITTNSPVNEGETLTVDINATDPDGDPLAYSVIGHDFIANENIFSWNTDYNSAGEYTLTAIISDGNEAVSADINVQVINTNRAPEISSIAYPLEIIGEGETIIINVNAADPDNDPLSYAISSPVFDANAASFSWITDYNSAGDYTLTITVSDGELAATADINLHVNNVNRAPEILSIATNSPVMEGETIAIDVNASDIDGETLEYQINSPLFDTNAGTFSWDTDYNSAGIYTFTVTVSDGNLSASADVNVEIMNVNRAPIIHSIAYNGQAKEGELILIDVNASDPDNDALAYSASPSLFDINGSILALQIGYDFAGDYNFTLAVSDGNLETFADINITVLNTNRAPEILAAAMNSPANEGETLIIDINAIDPDGDALSYSTDSNLFSANGSKFTWNTDYKSAGDYNITITVSDGSLSASKEVLLTINEYAQPLAIEISAESPIFEGERATIQVIATGLDEGSTAYSIDSNLFYFDHATNTFNWDTGYDSAGDYNFLITASDGERDISGAVQFRVEDKNRAPELELVSGMTEFVIGEFIALKFNASDPDNGTLTFSADPVPFKFYGNNFIWKADVNSIGEFTVTITASDGNLSTSRQARFMVYDPGNTCKDPDGGLNYYEKGTADDRVRGIGGLWNDTCRIRTPCKEGDPGYGTFGICAVYSKVDECSGDACNLQEGYCENGKVTNIAYYCEFGCSNGACMTQEQANQVIPASVQTHPGQHASTPQGNSVQAPALPSGSGYIPDGSGSGLGYSATGSGGRAAAGSGAGSGNGSGSSSSGSGSGYYLPQAPSALQQALETVQEIID